MNPYQLFSLTAGICMAATIGLGQESIQGTVCDPQGRAVDGAELVLYREGSASKVGRTVGRSLATLVVSLMEGGLELQPNLLCYLNRLSDLLWLYGRQIEHVEGLTAVLRDEKTLPPRWSRAW